MVSIGEMETVELRAGLTWHPIRPLLRIRAIGVSADSAREAGQQVVEPHVDSTDGRGHEELYVAITGAARFTVRGDDVNAAAREPFGLAGSLNDGP